MRFPLLSRSRARRFISGVSPIDGFFAGVCGSAGLLTLLGDYGGGRLCLVSSSTRTGRTGCCSVASSWEACASSSAGSNNRFSVCASAYQYRDGMPSCLNELSSIDTITTSAIMNCASSRLIQSRFSS